MEWAFTAGQPCRITNAAGPQDHAFIQEFTSGKSQGFRRQVASTEDAEDRGAEGDEWAGE